MALRQLRECQEGRQAGLCHHQVQPEHVQGQVLEQWQVRWRCSRQVDRQLGRMHPSRQWQICRHEEMRSPSHFQFLTQTQLLTIYFGLSSNLTYLYNIKLKSYNSVLSIC